MHLFICGLSSPIGMQTLREQEHCIPGTWKFLQVWNLFYGRSSTNICGIIEDERLKVLVHHPVKLWPLPALSKSISWLLLCYKLSQKLVTYYASITMACKPSGQLDSDANLGRVCSILVQLTWICDHLGGWPKAAGSRKASLRSLAVAWLSVRVTGGLGHTSRSSNSATSSCGHHGPKRRAEGLRASRGRGLALVCHYLRQILWVKVAHKAAWI